MTAGFKSQQPRFTHTDIQQKSGGGDEYYPGPGDYDTSLAPGDVKDYYRQKMKV